MRKIALVLFVSVCAFAVNASAEQVTVIDKENGTAMVSDGKGNVAVADADGNVVVEDKHGNLHVEDEDVNTVSLDKNGDVLAADIEDEDGNRVIVE